MQDTCLILSRIIIIIITEDNVAVLSHQFHNENLMAYITKFVQVLQLKFYNTLQTRLAYRSDPGASDVLAEKHAKLGAVKGLIRFLPVK